MSLRFRVTPALPRTEINVTPMIDVILILLMIFMVVAHALARIVDLPTATYSVHQPESEDDITVTIHQDGLYDLVAAGVQPGLIRTDRLADELGRLYSGPRDRILYLKADSTLPFGEVERVMGIARRSGVRVVGAVSERRTRARM